MGYLGPWKIGSDLVHRCDTSREKQAFSWADFVPDKKRKHKRPSLQRFFRTPPPKSNKQKLGVSPFIRSLVLFRCSICIYKIPRFSVRFLFSPVENKGVAFGVCKGATWNRVVEYRQEWCVSVEKAIDGVPTIPNAENRGVLRTSPDTLQAIRTVGHVVTTGRSVRISEGASDID